LRHALDPARGAYNSPPDSLAGFKGAIFYRRGRGGEEGIGRGDNGKETLEEEVDKWRGKKGGGMRGDGGEGRNVKDIPPPLHARIVFLTSLE